MMRICTSRPGPRILSMPSRPAAGGCCSSRVCQPSPPFTTTTPAPHSDHDSETDCRFTTSTTLTAVALRRAGRFDPHQGEGFSARLSRSARRRHLAASSLVPAAPSVRRCRGPVLRVESVESTPNPSAFLLKLDAPIEGLAADGLRGGSNQNISSWSRADGVLARVEGHKRYLVV